MDHKPYIINNDDNSNILASLFPFSHFDYILNNYTIFITEKNYFDTEQKKVLFINFIQLHFICIVDLLCPAI